MNKLMIVDDSSTMRKIIKRVLRQAEVEVEIILEAGNGLEALEQLVANPDIALILSDVNMPEMNGIELVKKVREDRDKETLPIIMVTTEGGESMVSTAMTSGANGYVTKPFTPDTIRDALNPFL
ncbi:MAG: two-component system chemotaxis response regulator CheY [Candidatus Paceibacteria bacterium]|jgi:two-component system chemotaxis response regulator CheY